MTVWAGVDVGGPGKGFHVALVDDSGLAEAIANPGSVGEAVALLERARPELVAIDCPRRPAAAGEKSRLDERALAGVVCGIRYTPDEATIYGERPPGDDFYGWIKNGLALYSALDAAGLATVECFPTASWTRWGGARAGRGRGEWSAAVLRSLAVPGLPARLDQDARDAIGAALTARAHAQALTSPFGDIVVPVASFAEFPRSGRAQRADLP